MTEMIYHDELKISYEAHSNAHYAVVLWQWFHNHNEDIFKHGAGHIETIEQATRNMQKVFAVLEYEGLIQVLSIEESSDNYSSVPPNLNLKDVTVLIKQEYLDYLTYLTL